VIAACLLPLVVALAVALQRSSDDDRATRLTVTWGAEEGDPGCIYDPSGQVVNATITVSYEALGHDTVTVVVTAYADENTSKEVGAATRTLGVSDTTESNFTVPIHVDRPPHVDEDGVAACRLEVSDTRGLSDG
jgi:hypothetical protein